MTNKIIKNKTCLYIAVLNRIEQSILKRSPYSILELILYAKMGMLSHQYREKRTETDTYI